MWIVIHVIIKHLHELSLLFKAHSYCVDSSLTSMMGHDAASLVMIHNLFFFSYLLLTLL